ncbi:zinc finger protein CONSTANS-LIKE 13 [Solanum dulcamara]|uniref:zinc finger protein CONSTANS-LIKE 13 n=1 Tax=Solanum dulcamara TaxID=45834 RepID=UPI002486CDD0|nr:zinc finger protein CONSTANS-LIKE 13 [Solanum dulcamara]
MTELKGDQENHHKQQEEEPQRGCLCDFCGNNTALLYCRADSAKLCFTCDREVHSTNQLFTKHTRWLLCNLCDSSPASILCCTESYVFCQNCDWESHNKQLSVHERRPLEGFSGCPCVSELLSIFGFENLGKKELLYGVGGDSVCCDGGYGFSDWVIWDTPSVVSLDDLIANNDSGHNFQAIGVPPLPKNRNAACGKHKEEILCQLRELSKLEPNSSDDQDETVPTVGFQSMESAQNCPLRFKGSGFMQNSDQHLVPSSEVSAFKWRSDAGEFADQGFSSSLPDCFIETKCLLPDRGSDVCDASGGANEEQSHNPPTAETTFQMVPKIVHRELNSQERETAVSRYKEKKKTRRYEKHIRYESRKARAETRTRIKGRFAKMDYRDSSVPQ